MTMLRVTRKSSGFRKASTRMTATATARTTATMAMIFSMQAPGCGASHIEDERETEIPTWLQQIEPLRRRAAPLPLAGRGRGWGCRERPSLWLPPTPALPRLAKLRFAREGGSTGAIALAIPLQPVDMHPDMRGFRRRIRQRDGAVEGHAGVVIAAKLHLVGA